MQQLPGTMTLKPVGRLDTIAKTFLKVGIVLVAVLLILCATGHKPSAGTAQLFLLALDLGVILWIAAWLTRKLLK